MAPLAFPSFFGPARPRGRGGPALYMFLLIALAVVLQPASVQAVGWCRADPTFKIDGQIIHVDVASYSEIYAATTGPIRIKIKVPTGIKVGTVALDNGFDYGYDIDIVKVATWDDPAPDDPMRLEVWVLVPAAGDRLPVQVLVYDDGSVFATQEGQTKDWIRVRTRI